MHVLAKRRLWLAATYCLAAIVMLSLTAQRADSAAPVSPFAVTGYVPVGNPSDATIARLGSSVSDFGIDGAVIDGDARSIVQSENAHSALQAAHLVGRPASFLISNYSNENSGWLPQLASDVLGDDVNRAAVVGAIATEVSTHDWDGVTVDLEGLSFHDTGGLLEFMRGLRATLPAGKQLDITVPAPGDQYGNWDGFDMPAIAAVVDHVVVMAYDQHYAGGAPGPVGGLPWVRRAIADSAAAVDPNKLRLGIAGYGYRWRKVGDDESLSVEAARALAGKRARWSRRQGEWHARLRDGSVLWWSDRRSIANRYALARRAGLQGAAIWSLNAVDSLP